MPRQVEQFAPDLEGGQPGELAGGGGAHVRECLRQPQHRALHHVRGVGAGADLGEVADHPPGEAVEPSGDGAEEVVGRRPVAAAEAVDAVVHPEGVVGGVGHGTRGGGGAGHAPREAYRGGGG